MRAMFRSRWKNTSRTARMLQIIMLMAAIVLIVSLIGGYFFNWAWTGFGSYTPPTSNFQREKTLYDWLQLIIVPVAISFGVWWLSRLQQQVERDIALDNQREAALKEYIDKLSELVLHENLRKSDPENEVQKIARTLTLTVLPRLDGGRKRSILQFLYESRLIDKGKRIVDLNQADLSSADLPAMNLSGADLSGATLRGANLFLANLSGANLILTILTAANLFEADLKEANLEKAFLDGGTDLSFANLREANLQGAILKGTVLKAAAITSKQLDKAVFYEGVIMPDGSMHP